MLITAEEAQKILGFKTDQTIYRWAKRGWIKKIPFGSRAVRFDSEEINDISKNGLNISNRGTRLVGSPPRSPRRRKRAWD